MGRIKNKSLYPIDPNITLDDYVIGSDIDNDGKTQNYSLRGILGLVGNAVIKAIALEPVLTMRSSQKPTNAADIPNSWLRVTKELDTSICYKVARLEVTLHNYLDFKNPVLLLDRYSPNNRKGINKSTGVKEYSRSAYKHEQPTFTASNHRVNEFPISQSVNIIDILPEKHFDIVIKSDLSFLRLTRRGGRRHSRRIRLNNISKHGVNPVPATSQVQQSFCFRLRYTNDANEVIETTPLLYFKTTCKNNGIIINPPDGEVKPIYSRYVLININHELMLIN